jgi:hypothetical protein
MIPESRAKFSGLKHGSAEKPSTTPPKPRGAPRQEGGRRVPRTVVREFVVEVAEYLVRSSGSSSTTTPPKLRGAPRQEAVAEYLVRSSRSSSRMVVREFVRSSGSSSRTVVWEYLVRSSGPDG